MNIKYFFSMVRKFLIIAFLPWWLNASSCSDSNNNKSVISNPRIILIKPAVHKALDMIEQGLQDTWAKYGKEKITVFNAKGEATLMQSILEAIAESPDDVAAVLPIGRSLTAQAINTLSEKTTIVGVAADVDVKPHPNTCTVMDEVAPIHTFTALRQLIHDLRAVTLVISNHEKNLSEANDFVEQAKKIGIVVQVIVVDNAADINVKVSPDTINQNSSALVLLKDHVTVSAVPTFNQICQERNILLITSDEGSVAEGAPIGVGVSEYEIGVKAAEAASRIVHQGQSPSEVGVVRFEEISTYVNTEWFNGCSCTSKKYRAAIEKMIASGTKVIMV